MSVFQIGQQWIDSLKMRKAAKEIRQALMTRLTQAGVPGAGLELTKTPEHAQLAKFVVNKYKDMEATLTGDSIVIALKLDMAAVTTELLRSDLARCGMLGQEAINQFAEASAEARAMGLPILTRKSVPIPDEDYKDENWDPESPSEKAKVAAAEAKAAAAAQAAKEKREEDARVAQLVAEAEDPKGAA